MVNFMKRPFPVKRKAEDEPVVSPLNPTSSHRWQEPFFRDIRKATFLSRPNRFVIRCDISGETIDAYLPNPGRLWELLFPGSTVYLVRKEAASQGKLDYTAVAVEREGRPVLLHTHLANAVISRLIHAGKLPGLEDAKMLRMEASVGHSRFDFLLERDNLPFYLEVKSCTLFGRRIAMFPDAVTRRGKRHIDELLALSRQGISCGVIFVVHWPQVDFFLPDYHTDLDFCRSLQEAKKGLFIKALSLEWRPDLGLGEQIREVTIPWETIAREAEDRGSYMILLTIVDDLQIAVGSLGDLSFPAGYYVYVGAARSSMTKQMERHLRNNRANHEHIDYLRKHAKKCISIPIRTDTVLEHDLARSLATIADDLVPHFGSSGCQCVSHLFRFAENPLHLKIFVDMIQYFRIDRLEAQLPLVD